MTLKIPKSETQPTVDLDYHSRLFRYVRLIVNCISVLTFRPVPLPESPTYTSNDVTIILPTIAGDDKEEELRNTILSCLQCMPFEMIIVTIEKNRERAETIARQIDEKRIKVRCVAQANKRRQMCRAIPEVNTRITIFADDDVIWPPTLLHWILAPFEDKDVGGVGTSQRLRRESYPSVWNFLGACYLERRNFDIAACTHVDGGLPCLSGRTVAYRTHILQEAEFTYGFQNETWRSFQLNADDDNFITRWMVTRGWKTYVQYHKEAEVKTTLESNAAFLKQCLRWSRSNWRSNMTSLFVEGHVWWRQPWSTYAVQQTTLTAWSIPVDAALLYLCYKATENWELPYQQLAILLQTTWMLGSKFVKIFGHLVRNPEDVLYFPIYIVFGYFHCLIKLYALLTLSETAWGSREGADIDNKYRMMKIRKHQMPPTMKV
ncbi:MAG: hypothetical protein M1820_003159 [Bogoriella megaspora]|nr:MAG: hypothetical protein M1820_003159 [Bogoriella megaspora]